MTHFHCMESPKKQKGKNEVLFKLDNQETLTEPSEICVPSKYLVLWHFCFFSFFPQCVKKLPLCDTRASLVYSLDGRKPTAILKETQTQF